MDVRAAAALIRDALPQDASGTWVDLGAGSGTFTMALASLLAPGSRVIAVDRDADALDSLQRQARRFSLGERIAVLQGDFRGTLDLPPLHGALFANSLHFVPPAERSGVLARLTRLIRPGGRLLVVDYEGRGANTWVPYPLSRDGLAAVLRQFGLPGPQTVASRPSRYGGRLYVACTVVEPGGTPGASS